MLMKTVMGKMCVVLSCSEIEHGRRRKNQRLQGTNLDQNVSSGTSFCNAEKLLQREAGNGRPGQFDGMLCVHDGGEEAVGGAKTISNGS